MLALLLVNLGLAAEIIEITPKFEPGQSFEVATTSSQNLGLGGPPPTFRTTVRVKVLSASADGAVLEWLPIASSVQNVPPDQETLVAGMQKAINGVRLEAMFDGKGRYTGLRNRDDVSAHVTKGMEGIRAGVLAAVPAEMRAHVERIVSESMSADAAIANSDAEIRAFFAHAGGRFEAGVPVSSETEAKMPYGGAMRMITTSTLKSRDSAAGTAVIETKSEADPASMEATKRAMAQALLPPDVQKSVDISEFKMSVRETITSTVDLKTGLTVKRQQQSTFEAGVQRVVTTSLTEIRRP